MGGAPEADEASARLANAVGPRVRYNAERRKQDVPALAFMEPLPSR